MAIRVHPNMYLYAVASLSSSHQTYAEYMGFIKACAAAVAGKAISSSDYPVSAAITTLLTMLQTLIAWVAEYPPLKQPMRFGNRAFCSWHK